jgi:hypothetical protein
MTMPVDGHVRFHIQTNRFGLHAIVQIGPVHGLYSTVQYVCMYMYMRCVHLVVTYPVCVEGSGKAVGPCRKMKVGLGTRGRPWLPREGTRVVSRFHPSLTRDFQAPGMNVFICAQ